MLGVICLCVNQVLSTQLPTVNEYTSYYMINASTVYRKQKYWIQF